jgi:hypothetical protein
MLLLPEHDWLVLVSSTPFLYAASRPARELFVIPLPALRLLVVLHLLGQLHLRAHRHVNW